MESWRQVGDPWESSGGLLITAGKQSFSCQKELSPSWINQLVGVTARVRVGVGVQVEVGVGVAVFVLVAVGVRVGVMVGVRVRVPVTVGV